MMNTNQQLGFFGSIEIDYCFPPEKKKRSKKENPTGNKPSQGAPDRVFTEWLEKRAHEPIAYE